MKPLKLSKIPKIHLYPQNDQKYLETSKMTKIPLEIARGFLVF